MFKAKNLFDLELIVVYSDIYVEKEIFKGLALNKKDLVLTADKSWQEYYMDRSLHPEEQAEKIIIDNNSKILEIGKDLIINKSKKYYEFIGLFKASEKAAVAMKNTFLMIDNKSIRILFCSPWISTLGLSAGEFDERWRSSVTS